MEQKINIAELLKDCPTGMELGCTMYEDVYFDYVDELNNIHCYIQQEFNKTSVIFNQDGTPTSHTKSKCVIFPKEKTTWEGFHRPFKDGDVLSYQCQGYKNRTIYIYMQHNKMNTTFYVALSGYSDSEFIINEKKEYGYALNGYNDTACLASDEEKQKLFDAIKANGYHWNDETKTLEKLPEPKFKVGDKIVKKDIPTECWYVQGVNTNCNSDYFYYIVAKGKIANLHFKDQDEWELAPVPKFKVGDIIQDITGICKVKITEVNVEDKCYLYKSLNINGIGGITFNRQDDWELVPNKFDVINFEPFMKVLVRSDNSDVWECDFFSSYNPNCSNKFHCIGAWYNICIPYIGNEHLRGTTDDCDDYYKL